MWPQSWHNVPHLYGYSHGSLPATRTSLDVGVDCWDWAPVTLARIMERVVVPPAVGLWS